MKLPLIEPLESRIAPATLTISPSSQTEGNTGSVAMLFNVDLSEAPTADVTVDFSLSPGTAAAGVDYTDRTGTLTFTPTGSLRQQISVSVLGDLLTENNETFTVILANPSSGVTLSVASATGTIFDNDTPSLAISPAARVAENSGPATFTVTLSNPTAIPIAVDYRTLGGTATADADYTAVSLATLTFAPGEISKTISIAVSPDVQNEVDETFQVQLLNPRIVGGASLSLTTHTGTGVILNDDRSVSIANGSSTESSASVNFVVSLVEGPSAHPVTVFYTTREAGTAPARATNSQDFVGTAGSLVIPVGSPSGTIAVPILNDGVDEADQTFEVVITSVSNAAIANGGVATATILDDDAAPTVQIVPTLRTAEGSADSTVNFTVSLSQRSEKVVTVNYTTVDQSATSGADFTAAAATLSFSAGQVTRTIPVVIKGDTVVEPDEAFQVVLSAATNATLVGTAATSTATIANDDAAPTLSVADVAVAENAGTLTFNVVLSRPYAQAVTVQYATVADSALAGTDFTPESGTLTFAANQTSLPVVVSIANNDGAAEKDERFFLRLSTATGGAVILDGEAVGLIQNDDVSFAIGDVTVAEEGAGNALVTVTRSGTGAAFVQYRTVPGTALSASDRDFTAVSGTLFFAATDPATKTISIPIRADSADENNEQFTVELFAPVDAVITDGAGTVTITDNDAAPTLSAANVTVTEGSASTLTFTVQLSAPNEREEVVLQFETIDGTATSSGNFADFTLDTGELRFAAGETSKNITVNISDDSRDEANQTFTLRLKDANAAFTAGGTTLDVLGTIVDNDAAPTLAIVSALTVAEGESSVPLRSFTARLSGESEQTVTVKWSTENSPTGPNATAGADYSAVSSTVLTFAPGDTEETFAVTLVDDALDEEDEKFDVVLSDGTNATLTTARQTATITDNDLLPAIRIGDNAIVEGSPPAITFNVTLSAPSGRPVSVNFATVAVTATSSGPFADFLAQNGTLTFAPNETSKTISIPVLNDAFREEVAATPAGGGAFTLGAEKFTVALSGAVNSTIADASGEGSIFNDADTALGLAVADVAIAEGAVNTTRQLTFRVQLSAPAPAAISFFASTRNGTAVAGEDYAAIANGVSIAGPSGNNAGATFTNVSVNITGDAAFEATESFFLDLTQFTGAPIVANLDSDARLTARGTIYNDDVQYLNGGRTVQWIDVDGDLVTLTSSRGSFAGLDTLQFSATSGTKLWLQPTGDVGGRQLVLLSLLNLGGFAGASVSITADKQPGFSGATDGLVNVGEIRAAQRIGGELDWIGVDLLDVTVEGDLTRIVGGDNVSTMAIRKLDVQSLGVLRNAPSSSDFQSEVLGPIGTVRVHGDIGGQLKLIGQEFGRIGTLTVDGALRGGSADGTGSVIVSGRVAVSSIGEIIGGTGDTSGALFGNNGGTFGNVTVLGGVKGGSGPNSGIIVGSSLGHVKLGPVVGGAGEDSGSVQAVDSFISSLTISGALTGGAGVQSGRVAAQTSIGQVKIGSVVGGAGSESGSVFALNGTIAGVTVDGSVTGSTGTVSARIAALSGIGFAKIGGSLQGGAGSGSGSLLTLGNLGTTTVGGDVIGGGGTESGSIQARSLSFLSIAGDLQGGPQTQSGTVIVGQEQTQNNQTVFVGGFLRTLRVGGDVIGGTGSESGMVLAGSTTTTTVGGAVIGGAGTVSGAVRFLSTAGQITVGENNLGQSIVGGAGNQSGRIRVDSNVGFLTLAGDIVGGSGNFGGALLVGGDLTKLAIRGGIIGGNAPATGDPLQSSGFLSVGLLKSGVISGDVRSGTDNGAGLFNSGAIRSGRIESLVIEGSVVGKANAPVVISAAATIDASNVAIKSLLIKGGVNFAEILGGYDGSLTNFRGSIVSADAQIGTIQVLGNASNLNIVAGSVAGADGRFGDATDVRGSGSGVRDSSRVVSSIASVILRGSVSASAGYGIVAQHVVSMKTGPTAVAVTGLAAGAGNDLATAVPDASDLIVTNFRAVEVAI